MASDQVVDAQVGRPGTAAGGVVAYSSQRLPGDLEATASAALDGNPATVWSPGMGTGNQVGAWVQVNRPASSSVDHLNLAVVADGRHSVPTGLRISACDRLAADGRCPADAPSSDVTIPPTADGRRPGATVSVPVTFPAVTGKDLTVTVTGARLETTPDYSFQGTTPPISLPLGIAELGIPGTRVGAPAPTFPGGCRSDLLTIDGHPVSVALSGSTTGALQGGGLTVTPCGPDAAGITLAAGSHVVLSAPGATTGIDIDQLALDSAPGGAGSPRAAASGAALAAPRPGPAPAVRVVSQTATQVHLDITGATHPYWLVLGESINKGWKATVDGTGKDLGPSSLIDGFGNGWLVRPTGSATMAVTLRWTPQSKEKVALLVSALAVLACFALVLWPRRRSRAERRARTTAPRRGRRCPRWRPPPAPTFRRMSTLRATRMRTPPPWATRSARRARCHQGGRPSPARCAVSGPACSCPKPCSSRSSWG